MNEFLDGVSTAEASLDEIVRLVGVEARQASAASGHGVAVFGREGERVVVSAYDHGGVSTSLAPVQHIVRHRRSIPGGVNPNSPGIERSRSVSFHHRRAVTWNASNRLLRQGYLEEGVKDEVRRLLFDGRRALAMVATHRDLESPDFVVGDLDRVDARAEGWRRAILRALARYQDFEGAVAALLFAESGRLEHASARAVAWLTPARRARLEEVAASMSRGVSILPEVVLGDGVTARFTRLLGPGRARVLATLSPTSPWLIDASLDLTPRQRSVAAYAGAGARADEISEILGISPHTVRDHIKGVYSVLGVRTRAELARLVAEGGLE